MTCCPGKLSKSIYVLMLAALAIVLLAACTPAAAPTPAPTKAAPAASPTVAIKAAETATQKPAAVTPTAAAAKPNATPIKVGYLTPLTGPSAPFGALEKVSIALGEEDISKSGGINGYPIQVIRYDSPFDPQQAVTLVRRLATDDKVFAILGPYSSGEMDVAAPLANQLQIPLIGMKTTKPGFSDQYRPWEFRVTVTDDLHTQAVVAAFKKVNPNIKRVLIVGDTKESVTEFMVSQVWPKYLKEAGLDIQGTIGYDSGTTDFTAIVTKIKDAKPDSIAYSATPKGNPVGFAKELAAQGVKVPVMADTHFTPGLFAYQAGKDMEGWLSTLFIDPTNPDPKVQDFVKRWQAKADADPDVTKPAKLTLEANSYDVLMILADIMRKANLTPNTPLQEARTKIRDGFASLKDYKGVSGTISMGANGDATWPATVVVCKNGFWEVLK